MSIKIPSGSKEVIPTDTAEDIRESVESSTETAETCEPAPASIDPVERIAAQIAAGEIRQDQAIDLIVAHILNSNMIKAAPKEVLGELEAVLRTALNSDPELMSLRAVLSSLETD